MGVFRQFPYSNFHEMNMDEIIKIIKNMLEEWATYHAEWDQWMADLEASWTKYQDDVNAQWAAYQNTMNTAWQSMQNFINNYFDNLDVQEEINNKIVSMIQTGEFGLLVNEYIPPAVNAWLNLNITEPTGVVIDTSLSVAGACADAKATGDAINTLAENVYMNSVSNQEDINLFFKELLLIGIDATDIAIFAAGGTASHLTINFKNSNAENIATFSVGDTTTYTDGYLFLKALNSDIYMIAFVDWTKLTPLFEDNYPIIFNNKINDISQNILILEKLTDSEERAVIPSYTRTVSNRININGTIESTTGSRWFYSSPIAVDIGDVVIMQSKGNANAIPIAYTNADGDAYESAIIYGGTEPSIYNLSINHTGYIAISGYDDVDFIFIIYKNPYIAKLLDPLDKRLAECENKLTGDGGGVLSLDAIDYGIKMPTKTASANTTTLIGWQTDNGASLSLSKKYDNVNRVMKECVTIDSQTGNGMAWFNLPEAVNANTHPLLVSVCVGEYNDTNPVAGNIGLEIYSGTARNSSNKITYELIGSTNDSDYNPVYNHNGWYNFCIFVPSIPVEKRFINGSNFDPTNVTAVGIHVYNTRDIANVAHVAEMSFMPAMLKPGIVTIIDNFGTKVPDMADYAYSKGVRLNLSIIPGFYEGASGAPICASQAELDRVAQQGHCIWNHTWTHAILNDLTYPEIQDQVNLAEKWMMLNGYDKDKKFVSNPSARLNTVACNALLDTNAEMIFHKWSGAAHAVYVPYYPTLRCIQTTVLDQEAVYAGLNASDIAGIAEKCMTYGGVTIIGFHDTFWNLDNGVSWKEYIDAISEINGVYHYGLDEIYEGLWC